MLPINHPWRMIAILIAVPAIMVVGSPARAQEAAARDDVPPAVALAAGMATPGDASAVQPASADHENAVTCLATAIGYEAGFEPLAGQQAVAEVVLNRVAHVGYPKTVCGVVFQGSERRTGCQFTFTCDGSLLRRRLTPALMVAMRAIAEDAIAGIAPRQVPGATHYHASYVHPYWAASLTRVAQLGQHIFYRQPDGADPAILPGYLGGEAPAMLAGMGGGAADRAVVSSVKAPPKPGVFAPWGLKPR